MAIQINNFIMYLNNGNYTNDFEMFLNYLADDEKTSTVVKDKDKIIVNDEIFIIFNESLKNKHFNFSDIVFNKTVTFQGNYENGLEFNFENTYFEKLNILNCNVDNIIFSGEINYIKELNISGCNFTGVTINSNIQGEVKFQKCNFKDFNKYNSGKNIKFTANFVFDFCKVDDIVNLINFDFENKVSFKMSKFKDNVYFNNSYFKDYADFHECEFEKTACFYGVTFEKAPNFSQAIFKGNLNAVNINLNFTFDDLQEKIKQEYEDFNKGKNEQDKKSLDKFANDFRDSFRVFKSTLIKDNNALDASKFHKYELYCKEIELKEYWDKKGIESKNQQDLEKNTWRARELVDFLLLKFYRKLCNHHTDFLKVFNNFVLLIALYALFVFLIGYEIKPYKTNVYNNDLSKVNFLIEFKNQILNSSFIQNYYGHILILFCIFYLWIVYLSSLFLRYCLVCISYIVAIIAIGYNIAILNPLIGKLIGYSIELDNNFFIMTTFAYNILIFLVLFSLQKTARKNSIVPS